jgi:hypothetical protein
LTTENIGQLNRDKFIYSVYQIDYDAFDVVFKVVLSNDTSEIFKVNISDGFYSKNSFHFHLSNDTLIIFDPRQTKTIYYQTKNRTTVIHTKPTTK